MNKEIIDLLKLKEMIKELPYKQEKELFFLREYFDSLINLCLDNNLSSKIIEMNRDCFISYLDQKVLFLEQLCIENNLRNEQIKLYITLSFKHKLDVYINKKDLSITFEILNNLKDKLLHGFKISKLEV